MDSQTLQQTGTNQCQSTSSGTGDVEMHQRSVGQERQTCNGDCKTGEGDCKSQTRSSRCCGSDQQVQEVADPLIRAGDWIDTYFAHKQQAERKAREFTKLFLSYYCDFNTQPQVVWNDRTNRIRVSDHTHDVIETGVQQTRFTDLPTDMVVTCEQRNRRIVHLDQP